MANEADLERKYFRMAPLMPASLSHIYDKDLFRIFINGINLKYRSYLSEARSWSMYRKCSDPDKSDW